MSVGGEDLFSRTRLLIGEEALAKLAKSRVAVFGLGGVGSYAVEALVRSGVGAIDLIDHDTVSVTNLNRQLYATCGTLGEYKTEVAKRRVRDINPDALVTCHRMFYLPDTAKMLDLSVYDYIIDAVDTITAKIELAVNARNRGVRIISCMGTGNRLDPTAFRVADIYDTYGCPVAKVMRRELRKREVEELKVVFSTETPFKIAPEVCRDSRYGDDRDVCLTECRQADRDTDRDIGTDACRDGRPVKTVGSVAFVPSAAGLIMAGEVIKDLIGI